MGGNSFPVTNRRDDLTIDLHYLRRRVGLEMFQNYNYADMDDMQQQEVSEAIDDGLRQYYAPPAVPALDGTRQALVHSWSFMRPTWRMSTASTQRTYPLPENFENPLGDMYYEEDEGEHDSIQYVSTIRTLRLEARTEDSAPPRYYSIEAVESTGETPQGQQLVLHPTPDTTYKLQLQYQAVARKLTEEQPYPLGGQFHGPGLLASCLAVAEARKQGAQGPRYQEFISTLAGNISRDTQRGASLLGYNGNNRRYFGYGRADLRRVDGIYYDNVRYGDYMD